MVAGKIVQKMATGVKFPLSGIGGGQHFGENGKGSTKMVGVQNMGGNGRCSLKVVGVNIGELSKI